jgi:hypothetical protein
VGALTPFRGDVALRAAASAPLPESEGEGKNFVNASRASLSFDLAIG